MPSLGPLEILVVAVVALIVFGPERLPQLARDMGRAASNMRRMAAEVREEFELAAELDDEEKVGARRAERPGVGADAVGSVEMPAQTETAGDGDTKREPA